MGLSIGIDLVLFFLLFALFIYVFISVQITNLHKVYFMFHFAMMLWPFCLFVIKATDNPQLQLLYIKAAFVDLSLLAIGWLVFTIFLTNRSMFLQRKKYFSLFVPAFLAIIAVVANPNGLFVSPVNHGFIVRTYGPVFWIVCMILISYVFISLYILYTALVSDIPFRVKKQVKLVLQGIFVFSVFALLDVLLNVVLAEWLPVIPGLTSLGILLSDIFFVIAIYRDKVFDIVIIAHQDVIDTIGIGMLVLDENENVLEINRALIPHLDKLPGERFDMEALLSQAHFDCNMEGFLHKYQQHPLDRAELELSVLGSNLTYISIQVVPIIITGVRVGRIITFQDISELRRLVNESNLQNENLQEQNQSLIVIQDELFQANRKLELMALTDSLTGCYNRHYLTQHLEHEVMMHERCRIPFSLFLIDIDFFKSINDKYGHMVGDEVICGTVEAIKQTLRQTDILARFGGEEFMIYLPHTHQSDAVHLAEQVKLAVAFNKVIVENVGSSIPTTISIGVLSIENFNNENQSDPKAYLNELFVSVDEALYQAKKEGRNRVISRLR
ncbi:diguanylate cyclase (GGDEF) domain-containing protein [Paenibacillus sp. 1_12]|uniref:histidine kinase N-terminal 7TM domain-containing diguanylate cyclase n=1 Tax=Paenibacillus sp. 1_12 TaxID=1566278 RepID=UPI0008E5F08B|nr:diguanylate cyclase [Paenibacillus sp. 1_12]SFM37900.1 diguanylate cyclase (GGDEF) domain-containing protein [Paenibacillus sp. 1_12]